MGLLAFIDLKLEGTVAEYFERAILFDREKLSSDSAFTRGTFYWPRLKDILTDIAVMGFIILEATVFFSTKYARDKERKETINKLEKRIDLLTKGYSPERDEDFKLIDAKISEILRENEVVKQESLIEMGKKNDLVTFLAHDLKTPLTSIIGYLTILDESDVPDEVRKDYIKKLLDKSYRLEDLTNEFFDITRFNLHEIPLNKNVLDGEFFISQMAEELYPLLKSKNLSFDINIPENMKIYVDGSLFARALNNLLKNAIAYSNKDSTIKITGKINVASTILSIENDGDIISEQELKLIFEKFYRRDKSRNESSGAGLGLAIAREIIHKHKGSLDAESLGGHTTFKITLPNL